MGAAPASLPFILEAIGHLDKSGDPKVFQALLSSAQEKAVTLIQQNEALSGDALRSALEAQRTAEVELAAVRHEIIAQRSRADAAESSLSLSREAFAQQKDLNDQMKSQMSELRDDFSIKINNILSMARQSPTP